MRIARLGKVAAVVAVMAGATIALGAGITPIGVLTPFGTDAPTSAVYAISPDGTYAVGSSNGQNVAATATISQAVIWSAASGLVQLPNNPSPAPDQATSARGVVVKANGDIGVAAYMIDPGFDPYRMNHYTASPGALGSGTYVVSPGTHNLTIGTYNAARNYDDGPGNTLSDNWVIAGQRSNGGRAVQSLTGTYSDSGALAGYSRVYNVPSRVVAGSSRGYAAGYEKNNTTLLKRALFGVGGSTQTVIPGSAGYQSEALGMSPKTTSTAGSGVIVGYDQDISANNYKHAFYYTQGAAGMTLLSELAGDVLSEAIDVRLIGSNRIIGGYSSDGTTEKAVLWDTTGVWDSTGAPMLVSGLLTAAGLDVSAWSSLTRVTSMSDNGKTVAGWGVWAADGTTRGFIATIPEPATLALLTLGGLAFLRRRRH